MPHDAIQEGYEVFLADGDIAFGAVLRAPVSGSAKEFAIYVEDAGEFVVPVKAVKDVHSGKVILIRNMLHQELLQAIRHAHDEEHSDS